MTLTWCRDPDRIPEIANFLIDHLTPDYISHDEIRSGRAASPDAWGPDLPQVVEREVRDAVTAAAEGALIAEVEGRIAGLALVEFLGHYALVHDLLVDPAARGGGVGGALLAEVERVCRARGVTHLFLESGARNSGAHRFFARAGFEIVSHTFRKELPATRSGPPRT